MAQVLAGNPRALLLDEPTSALDIAHQLHVLDVLRAATSRRGLTTIAVLHDLNAAARFADRIALMQAGRLVAVDTPARVLTPVGGWMPKAAWTIPGPAFLVRSMPLTLR